MEISFSTVPGNLRLDTGYGYAGYNMLVSLKTLGHTVPYDNPKSLVQIHFSQPNWYRFHENQYKIGYTPWESSKVSEKWVREFNKCDEVWATSPKVAEWYRDNGVEPDIFIYPHGINPLFAPRQRKWGQTCKFLHVGDPAPRKDAAVVVEAFRQLYGNNPDYHLTLKCFFECTVDVSDLRNVTVIRDSLSTEKMVELYYAHDALIYPSWGEGFGLIPLEAMATGLPTIITEGWAMYQHLAVPIKSELVESPFHEHPGLMFKPDLEDLMKQMHQVSENFEHYNKTFYETGQLIHKEYNWLELTEKSFKHVVEKFS